jgi:DnaJ-class molecular chaperone
MRYGLLKKFWKSLEKGDYYGILGVRKADSQDQIKAAYRELAMKYHPDKNPGSEEAEDRFKAVSEAYYTLGNSDRKAQYDADALLSSRTENHIFETNKQTSSNVSEVNESATMGDVFNALSEVIIDCFKGLKANLNNYPRRHEIKNKSRNGTGKTLRSSLDTYA